MKKVIFRSNRVNRRMASSHLGITLANFSEYLAEHGYAVNTIHGYIQAVEHFGFWMGKNHWQIKEINLTRIRRFRAHLPHCHCPTPHNSSVTTVQPALRHFIAYLRLKKLIHDEPPSQTRIDQLVLLFDQHLAEACGLAAATRFYRRRFLREFLDWRFGQRPLNFHQLRQRDFSRFISHRARKLKPSSVQVLAVSLRSFVRYLELRGKIGHGLDNAILASSNYGNATLPKTMTPEQRRQLLGSFTPKSAAGKRDRAMVLCQMELGLRAHEVAQVNLEDLDWHQGVLTIRSGKSSCERPVPIPSMVAQAIISYLQKGRPSSSCRRVFLRHTLPVGMPIMAEHVRGAMRRAYARAGLDPSWTGTHILRRTFASRLYQKGVRLKEIADLLGHRSINTTRIYTQINLRQLRQVALPWPT